MTAEVTGVDHAYVNFEHRSYHCATLTAHLKNTICAATRWPEVQISMLYNPAVVQFCFLYF
jgi:hypothetical protein